MLTGLTSTGMFDPKNNTYIFGTSGDKSVIDDFFTWMPTQTQAESAELTGRCKPKNLNLLVDQAIFIYKQFIKDKETEFDSQTAAADSASWKGTLYKMCGYTAGVAELVTLATVIYIALPVLGIVAASAGIAGTLAGAYGIYKYFDLHASRHYAVAEQHAKLRYQYQVQLDDLEMMLNELERNPAWTAVFAEKYPADEDYTENVEKLTDDLKRELNAHLEFLASQAIKV